MAVQRLRVPAGDFTFDVVAAGPPRPEPIVLLHGFPQSPSAWRRVMDRLAALGHRVLVPAQRGYSPGANPPEASAYGVDSLAADVVAICAALGHRRFHVAGHDWGGAVAWTLAAKEPSRVRSLTAVSTPHPRAMAEALHGSWSQRLHSSYMGFFQLPALPEALLGRFDLLPLGLACRSTGLSGAQWRRDAALLRKVGLRGPLNWYRAVRAAPPSAAATGRIMVPTLYVWGRDDAYLTRAAAERTAAQVDGPYRLVELDAGHWIPDRNHQELVALIDQHVGANARARR